MTWQPIDSAPKDGTPFIALNHDLEVWVSKPAVDGRLMYRTNNRWEPKRFEHVIVNGEILLREDREYAAKNECWRSDWAFWSRLYEFAPTHWMPLPPPPAVKD